MGVVNSASFLITEDCNLACKYCFELCRRNKNAMSIEVIHRGLELLYQGGKGRGFHAMVFGGEPLLRPDLVRELFDYGLHLTQDGTPFSAGIVTNATLLNDEIEALLTEYRTKVRLSLQLSIDGIQPVQDAYRVTRDGRGSFTLVERNIERFKHIFKDDPNSLTIHGCLNRNSLPYLFESYRFFREEWGFSRIWFMPVHEEDWRESDIEVYRQELNRIADYILKCDTLEAVRGYAPIDRCLNPDRKDSSAPCGAGKDFVSFTSSGDIYPCHHLYFQHGDELKVGDVFSGIDDSKRRIFLDYDSDDMTCPGDCDHRSNCARCVAVNYQVNGSILSQIRGNYCRMSHVEREIHLRVRGELEAMGIFKKNEPMLRQDGVDGFQFQESWTQDDVYYERFTRGGENLVLDAPAKNASATCGGGCKNEDERFEVIAAGIMTLLGRVDQLEREVQELKGHGR